MLKRFVITTAAVASIAAALPSAAQADAGPWTYRTCGTFSATVEGAPHRVTVKAPKWSPCAMRAARRLTARTYPERMGRWHFNAGRWSGSTFRATYLKYGQGDSYSAYMRLIDRPA